MRKTGKSEVYASHRLRVSQDHLHEHLHENTWEFNGTTRTETVTANAPAAVDDGRMDFDSSRGVCVLFGGWDGSAGQFLGTWDYGDSDWELQTNTTSPTDASDGQVRYDSARKVCIYIGGRGRSSVNTDVWEYISGKMNATYAFAGSGCAGMGTAPDLATAAGSSRSK